MALQGNQTAEFYKKRGRMMFILRQEFKNDWCPLETISNRVGLDVYKEVLKAERAVSEDARRLEWSSTHVRALTKKERIEGQQRLEQAAISKANEELERFHEKVRPPPTTGDKNLISSIEDIIPPWAKEKAVPKHEVDIEEESDTVFSSDCEVEVTAQEEPDVKFVSEKRPLKARLRAKASSSRVAEADEKEKEKETDMESLAPLKRKRQ